MDGSNGAVKTSRVEWLKRYTAALATAGFNRVSLAMVAGVLVMQPGAFELEIHLCEDAARVSITPLREFDPEADRQLYAADYFELSAALEAIRSVTDEYDAAAVRGEVAP